MLATPEVTPPSSTGPWAAPEVYRSAAYQAIGRFIVEFANAETSLAMTLENFLQRRVFKKQYSHEGMQVLAALSGNIRMEKLRTLTKDLATRLNSDSSDIAIIDSSSRQIKDLQEFRNRIAHYRTHLIAKDGRWCIQTSNKYNVRDYDKREMWRYSIETVEAAADDCLKVVTQISHALFPEHRDLLSKNALNYRPVEPFSFDMSKIERESMPLTKS